MTFDDIDDKLSAEAISPSGRYLATADKNGVAVQELATGQRKVLSSLPGFAAERIAWFGDESSVLVSVTVQQPTAMNQGSGAAKNQVWMLPLQGGAPRMLLAGAEMAVPSPDGQALAFLRDGRSEIWTCGTNGDAPHKLAGSSNGDTFSYVLWSPNSDRIMTDRVPADFLSLADASFVPAGRGGAAQPGAARRAAYGSYDAHSGALLAERDDVRFSSAALLRDGLLLYPTKQRDGTAGLAMVKTDLKTGAFASEPVFLSDEQAYAISAPKAEDISVTADGNALAIILERKNIDVYTADLAGATTSTPSLTRIARLSNHSDGNYPTSWTPDSRAVIFDTGVNGPISIYAQSPGSSAPRPLVQATSSTEKFAQGRFSPDGRWLLYLHLVAEGDKVEAVERVSATGGQPKIVPTAGDVEGFRCSIAPVGRCVLREVEGNKQFVYYELDPVHGLGHELARTSLTSHVRGDWAVSPDGDTIAVANHDPANPSIDLIQLAGGDTVRSGSRGTRELQVSGYGVVLSPSWARDGESLFVETSAAGEYRLLHVDLRGHITPLYESSGLIWAVPSPDGTRIAFPADTAANRNVWVGTKRTGR